MGYTRRDFVNAACEELGVSTYTFDLPPERLEEMGRRLDVMMATWNALGVRLGYTLPTSPGSVDLDAQTGAPDKAYEAIASNLAVKCAAIFGKQPMATTMATARSAYIALLSHFAAPIERQPGALPAGAGAKAWQSGDPFITPDAGGLAAGPDSTLDFSA